MGGLGIRRASSLALLAFIASAASISETQSNIHCGLDIPVMHYANLSTLWQTVTGMPLSEHSPAHIPANRNIPILQGELSKLLQSTRELSKQSLLKTVSFRHASDGLHSLPITSCVLRISHETISTAGGLALGVNPKPARVEPPEVHTAFPAFLDLVA